MLASESFGGSDSAAVAEAAARQLSGVQAVVDLRASMHDAAALLNKLPAAISFMALCLPPLTIGSHSVMAWVRSCRHEQPHRAVRVLTVVCPPAGGLSAPLMAQVASQVRLAVLVAQRAAWRLALHVPADCCHHRGTACNCAVCACAFQCVVLLPAMNSCASPAA